MTSTHELGVGGAQFSPSRTAYRYVRCLAQGLAREHPSDTGLSTAPNPPCLCFIPATPLHPCWSPSTAAASAPFLLLPILLPTTWDTRPLYVLAECLRRQ